MEWQLVIDSNEKLKFSTYGGGVVNAISADALETGVAYECEGWYDRVAETTNIKYRVIGSDTWIEVNEASGDITFSGAEEADIGYANWISSYSHDGQIWDVQIWDYATTTQLHSYPLVEGSGLVAHDTAGSADGTITVGAGGQSTFWGSRQDAYHYMATDGGSNVFVFNDTAPALYGTAVSTGTKSLTIMAKPNTANNVTLFTSNGKSLIFDYVSGTTFDIIYDASTIGIGTLGEWSTITYDIDLVSAFTIGGTTDDYEIGDFSLEDNGSWSAKAFDGTTAYNLDQTASMPDLTDNAVGVRQYPASTSGFVGDFDGVTDKVALSTSPTDSFSVAFSAKVTRDGGYNTAYSRLGVAVAIDTTAGDYRVRFNLGSGVDHIRSDALVFPLNEWKTCAVTWDDDTSTAKIFVEGVDVTGPTTGTLTGPTGTYAGNLGGPGFNGMFGGTLYNVKVWDSALSDADAILESSGSDASVSADSGYLDGTYYDDSTLPDLIGSANGTITGTILAQDGIVSTTSHLAGTNDTPINPPADVHNGGVYKVQQDAGDATLLTNLFWSANGSDYDEKTYINMLLHQPFDKQVVPKYDSDCMVTDIVTLNDLDSDQYDNMVTWLETVTCGGASLEPVTDGGDRVTDGNGHIILN